MTNSLKTLNSLKTVSVTVTFHPNLDKLRQQLESFPNGMTKIVIDNTATVKARRALLSLEAKVTNLHIIFNSRNLGLAAAMNQGVHKAHEVYPSVRYVFLLDQDSIPEPECLLMLQSSIEHLERRNIHVGAVGPHLLDEATGQTHGFHQMAGWRWRRVFPPVGAQEPVSCANINGSGTLMPIALFLELGGLDEGLFIDHVDTEWSFRLLAQGYSLWGMPNAVMRHTMGMRSLRFWLFGWRLWPARSPLRHRYLFRNAVNLMKRDYIPRVWKIWAVGKLALTFFVHGLLDHQRSKQMRAMLFGVLEGLRL